MKINRNGQAEPLTPETFAKVYNALNPPHKFILGLTWHCVERAGAICQLRRADCFDSRGKPLAAIVISRATRKDRVTREIPVTPSIFRLLSQIPLDDGPWLFPSYLNPNRPVPTDTYKLALSQAFKKLRMVGYSSHSARRGAITTLARAGVNARVIQQVSGHRSLENLQRYIDTSKPEIERAIALL
ncbi:site-specific integrase [Candidatus Synechococcus calcipolaris G9]|uniref:Site-specific integrase n=1 Tax=Candidatus Synechococcus calcipolaris G9 TaxID=1497997 RepID=A0ABT6F3X0_9SYNE|nr:site-specific integrase [Candidatus Synechococcus calcipolaris]MDG2992428.1 site-specific integrase [Candidatus Synechococcus calcipolaris G9]